MSCKRMKRIGAGMAHRILAVALAYAACLPAASAVPVIQLVAAPAQVGQPLFIRAVAGDLTDLFGYQFTINFDPARVRFVSAQEGGFLAQGGTTFFDGGSADNVAGTVSFVFDTLIGAVPGVSGSGELASFAFATLRAGPTRFSLSDVLALDSTLAPFDVLATPVIALVPEPGTGMLLLLGALSVAAVRTHRRRPTAHVATR